MIGPSTITKDRDNKEEDAGANGIEAGSDKTEGGA